jgi:hypothetical protein
VTDVAILPDRPTPAGLRPHPRPAFFGWLKLVRQTDVWAAGELGCSAEYVRLICLPFDDPKRRDPSGKLVRKIVRLTAGACGPETWHPPVEQILSGEAA